LVAAGHIACEELSLCTIEPAVLVAHIGRQAFARNEIAPVILPQLDHPQLASVYALVYSGAPQIVVRSQIVEVKQWRRMCTA
jgi:hypothetical protein